jgi:hypothetical protein
MGAQVLVLAGRMLRHGKKGAGAGNFSDGASDLVDLQRPAVTAFDTHAHAVQFVRYVISALF